MENQLVDKQEAQSRGRRVDGIGVLRERILAAVTMSHFDDSACVEKRAVCDYRRTPSPGHLIQSYTQHHHGQITLRRPYCEAPRAGRGNGILLEPTVGTSVDVHRLAKALGRKTCTYQDLGEYFIVDALDVMIQTFWQ